MKIQSNIELAPFSTFKIGGKAKYYCKPQNIIEIQEALDFAHSKGIATFYLGGGSNILISDKGYDGLIIHLTGLNQIKIEDNFVTVEAGFFVSKLAKKIASIGLTGLEFAGGLPGTIGGAVFMNAKAYGSSFSNIIRTVTVITKEGELKTLSNKEMQFSYKDSRVMHNKEIIMSTALELKNGIKKDIIKLTKKNSNDRKQKGQFINPNAGCIFKNDYNVGIPSGKLIQNSGLLGFSIGGGEVFSRHGNFIVNSNNATADDIMNLIKTVRNKVKEETGVELELEVRLLGF